MGNATAKEKVQETRSLDLSRRLTPEQYIKHTSGEFIEGCLLTLPWELYYDTISMYETVNASFNFICEIPEELSLHVPHLQFLDISHNQISSIPQSFHLLLHLSVLDISHNRLRIVPDALTLLPQLRTLNLAHNLLRDIPATLSNLKTLQKLNVSHNNIRALPGTLAECPHLEILVTLGNDLIHPPQAICDTGSEATLRYLRERHQDFSPPRSVVKQNVFTRIRGQQVVASVNNPESASTEYRQAQGTARANKRKCPLMPPADVTTLSPDQLKDMLLGLVYGAAIGDAYGLNTEEMTQDECLFFYTEDICLKTRIRDHLRSYYPPYDWSSNTDVMLLTLESLMRWGGVVDELELASQLDQWMIHGYVDLDPSPGYLLSPYMKKVVTAEGYSANPHAAADSAYKLAKDEQSRGIHIVDACDNSSLPSALIMGIPSFFIDNEVEMNAERICRATHADPVVRASCIFLALLLASLLQGKSKDSSSLQHLINNLKEKVSQQLTNEKEKQIFLDAFNENIERTLRGSRVTTTISLLLEVLASEPYDFKANLLAVIMRGGNGVSVHATVVGGILGAILGYSHLPQDWLFELPLENLRMLNSKLNLLLDLFGLP